jgi:SAM-dependent methyltransferase
LAGIWTPESQLSSVPVGLTEQFTEHAGNYAAKYASPAYFRRLIVRGLALGGARLGRAPRILDIGTGAGDNSVFPCLDLFENAEIIATDLSPDLLALLRREVDRRCVTESVSVACADAMLEVFVPESFDLVTGAAILHHLIDPSRKSVQKTASLNLALFAIGSLIFANGIDTILLSRLSPRRNTSLARSGGVNAPV